MAKVAGSIPAEPTKTHALGDPLAVLKMVAPVGRIAQSIRGQSEIWSDARAAEEAFLLRRYGVKRSIEGSNPSHSAISPRGLPLFRPESGLIQQFADSR